MLSVVKMLLNGEVGSHAFNSHWNYIVDQGKIMELCFRIFVGTLIQCFFTLFYLERNLSLSWNPVVIATSAVVVVFVQMKLRIPKVPWTWSVIEVLEIVIETSLFIFIWMVWWFSLGWLFSVLNVFPTQYLSFSYFSSLSFIQLSKPGIRSVFCHIFYIFKTHIKCCPFSHWYGKRGQQGAFYKNLKTELDYV